MHIAGDQFLCLIVENEFDAAKAGGLRDAEKGFF
jgi:hypothetical protein